MVRQQEIRDALAHDILVAAVPAHELPLADLRLHQQHVQVLDELLVLLQVLGRRRRGGQGGEAELRGGGCVSICCKWVSPGEPRRRGTYLGGGGGEGDPVEARQDVAEQLGVELDVFGDELGVFGVQREGGGGCLAGLDGAGQEVERENLHVRGRRVGVWWVVVVGGGV